MEDTIGTELQDSALNLLNSFDGHIDSEASRRNIGLAYDTTVLTQDGWKKHGDLLVGDFVDYRYRVRNQHYP